MKLTELRIGNLIYIDGFGETKITALNLYEWDDLITQEEVKPILLTEEWLLKFGFEYIEETGMYHDKYNAIVNGELSYIFIPQCTNDEDCYVSIKYVHQLQNLYFALTGEELVCAE